VSSETNPLNVLVIHLFNNAVLTTHVTYRRKINDAFTTVEFVSVSEEGTAVFLNHTTILTFGFNSSQSRTLPSVYRIFRLVFDYVQCRKQYNVLWWTIKQCSKSRPWTPPPPHNQMKAHFKIRVSHDTNFLIITCTGLHWVRHTSRKCSSYICLQEVAFQSVYRLYSEFGSEYRTYSKVCLRHCDLLNCRTDHANKHIFRKFMIQRWWLTHLFVSILSQKKFSQKRLKWRTDSAASRGGQGTLTHFK
jgi:hypothetical protein